MPGEGTSNGTSNSCDENPWRWIEAALLAAEGELEKARAVDELYETSEYSKRAIETELKPVYTVEARDSFPPEKEPQAGSSFKDSDFRQVGRNST